MGGWLYFLVVSRHMTILFTSITEQTLRVRAVQSTTSQLSAAHSRAMQGYLLLFGVFKPEQAER